MKSKLICLALLFFLVTILGKQSFSNSNSEENIEKSTHDFIIQFYKDLESGNVDIISKYFEKVEEKRLGELIRVYKNLQIDVSSIAFLESKILSTEPLIIKVVVREWYKILPPSSSMESLYILKDAGKYNWKILEISAMALSGSQSIPKDKTKRKIEQTAHDFITQYYKDLETGNTDVISTYYLKKLKKEDINYIIRAGKIYKIDRIDYIEINILLKDPLIVEVLVKEWYKPEVYPPPYLETLFVLKDIGGLHWKIIDITEPGL